MTCIIGLEVGDDVYMGADSASANGWDIKVSRLRKVFRVGAFLIGSTGFRRSAQLLEYLLDVRPQKESEDDMRYMVVVFVEAMRKCLKEGGFTKIENSQEEGGLFLVGFNGTIYEVQKNFQVCSRSDGFVAIGCGSSYALGSLWMTREMEMEPEERILKALETAGHFSNGVCAPYFVERL